MTQKEAMMCKQHEKSKEANVLIGAGSADGMLSFTILAHRKFEDMKLRDKLSEFRTPGNSSVLLLHEKYNVLRTSDKAFFDANIDQL